tara:strand:+ start:5108 stop:5401 length:294 start_codon:yes stop_codon:yes gene_type:complete
MSWKKILKEQTTLGDFGMDRGTRQATFPQMERDNTTTLQSEMPRIKSKVESLTGSMNTSDGPIPQSQYWLRLLGNVKSYEDLQTFKAGYKKETNLDI